MCLGNVYKKISSAPSIILSSIFKVNRVKRFIFHYLHMQKISHSPNVFNQTEPIYTMDRIFPSTIFKSSGIYAQKIEDINQSMKTL